MALRKYTNQQAVDFSDVHVMCSGVVDCSVRVERRYS